MDDMALDPITALLRPASKEDELRALADSLRKRKRAADFYSISTIKPLQQMGQQSGQDVMATAERQGVLREALAQRQARAEQDRMDREADAEAARLEREFKQSENRLDRESNEREAGIRSSGRGTGAGGYAAPKTQKERDAFEKGGTAAANLINLAGSYKDEYSPDVPMTGDITNFLGRKAEMLAPEAWTEKAGWWADYKEQAELVRRHALFGAALTRNEQTQWERAMITPNDGPETIRRKLATQSQMAARVAELDAARSLQKGYDPDQVLMNFGDVVDVPALAEKVADGSYFSELEARQKAAREEEPEKETAASDDPYENMTEEEIDAELARRKRG